MSLVWQQLPEGTTDGPIIVAASYLQQDEVLAQQAVNDSIEKAVEIVPLNISDESMYMIFEWNAQRGLLSIALTDEAKSNDSQRTVRCELPAMVAIDRETMRFWIRDYLTTCDGFMHFSLIAVFHTGDRTAVDLL
ncbi:hypothetical protein [Oceanicoccus sp. KOV_DT_Chl]|uniref:hypothetical protein n=1 Tax=Oceanicoccus sp. KOV_DT_Chl TaxID=1904639 RepID=UPI000C7B7A5D|nr:hypothetical protein [Oceanicoccus sp. KOV_DT_Chl]